MEVLYHYPTAQPNAVSLDPERTSLRQTAIYQDEIKSLAVDGPSPRWLAIEDRMSKRLCIDSRKQQVTNADTTDPIGISDDILPVAQHLKRVVPRPENIDVIAHPALKGVVASAANKHIVARAGNKYVPSAFAKQEVIVRQLSSLDIESL